MDRKKKKKVTTILSWRTLTNSYIESTRSSIAPASAVYTKFSKETTLHGLKHTVTPNLHPLERLLWFILTLSAFAGAVYCGLNQFSRYSSEPVVVSLQRDYRDWWSTFPAITVCFQERVNPDLARIEIERIWNVTENSDTELFHYYYGFIEQVADVSFRTNLQNFWKYQSDDTVRNVDLLKLARAVYPNVSLDVNVSQINKKLYWTPVMTEEGICHTLNSVYAEYQFLRQEDEWKEQELLKCHYHSGQCYLIIKTGTNVARYFVHSPFDIASAISNPTGEVMPNEELRIDYKLYWTPVMTEEGICHTLNSVYAEYQFLRQENEWKEQELLKCHYHSGQCYLIIKTGTNVARYFVHSPFDIASAISNPTGEVMPNEELRIDYKVVEIQAASRVKTLTPEQRRCRYPDEWLSSSIKSDECGTGDLILVLFPFPPFSYKERMGRGCGFDGGGDALEG
ncbi:hypothetical protein RR48_02167 [Papilio machaon]|uniref:Uncharacterized protein n=1 Tax=Papilio machaon TaxID=76193 RepID=A0A0N1IP59_PAPMA|nr:hypothetical protein RR48_02167 [Papilio machaon]